MGNVRRLRQDPVSLCVNHCAVENVNVFHTPQALLEARNSSVGTGVKVVSQLLVLRG